MSNCLSYSHVCFGLCFEEREKSCLGAQQYSHTFDKRDEKRNADRDERRCGGRVETEQSEKQQTEHCSPFMIRRLSHYTWLLAGSPFLLNLLWETLQHIYTSLLSPTPLLHTSSLSLYLLTPLLFLSPPSTHTHAHTLTYTLSHTPTRTHIHNLTHVQTHYTRIFLRAAGET